MRNLKLEAVKGHLLSEALRAEFKWPRSEAKILAVRTSAADFFAYFFHRRKKVGPHRRGDPFVYHTIGNTQKVTAVGTKLPWLALRRTGSKLARPWHAQTVPPLAPDAAPSSRFLSQCGAFDYRNALLGEIREIQTAALVLEALRNLQPKAVKGHLLSEAPRAEFKWPRPEARILAVRTSAADFFAYFFHRRKKVGDHRRGDPFVCHTIGNTQKVTAVGTKLPWLALRHLRNKLACPWHAQTVPPLAPDAAPS